MKITIESTTQIVEVENGQPFEPLTVIKCRLWEGVTEHGVKVQVLIPRIAALKGEDLSQFEAELQETRAPSAAIQAFPLKMVL